MWKFDNVDINLAHKGRIAPLRNVDSNLEETHTDVVKNSNKICNLVEWT